MSSVEMGMRPDPDSVYDKLNWHPPIPADRLDISGYVEKGRAKATEPGWAWIGPSLWVAEVKNTYDTIGGIPFLAVDECSSAPIYVARHRYDAMDRSGQRAREIVRELFTTAAIIQLGQQDKELRDIALALAGPQSARQILEAAVQETIYQITANEAAGTDATNSRYRQRLESKLAVQSHSYSDQDEIVNQETERGLRIETRPHDIGYMDQLVNFTIPASSISSETSLARQRLAEGRQYESAEEYERDIALARNKRPVGGESAVRFQRWLTQAIGRIVVGNPRYRPARFFSRDIASPQEIANSSVANMPASALDQDLFTHAIASLFDPNQHLQGNALEPLPFPDNSLAAITDFDGCPFHIQTMLPPGTDWRPVITEILKNRYQKLAFGGKMVDFPWAIHTEDYASGQSKLVELTEIAAAFTGGVIEQFDLRGLPRNTLQTYMSDSDREISDTMSPILNSPIDYFFGLIVSKSRERSRKALIAKARTLGLQDPTR